MHTCQLIDWIEQPAWANRADRPALSLEVEQTWTYRQLNDRVARFAGGLVSLGVKKGDRVGILLYNSLEYWALYLAITRIGAVAVRLNWRLSAEELNFALADSGTSVLCAHDAFAKTLAAHQSGIAVREYVFFPYDGVVPEFRARASDILETAEPLDRRYPVPQSDDLCMIMYTSGTTGRPKGAMWTHANTMNFAMMQILQWRYDENSVHLATGAMFHVGSFEDWMMPILLCGGHGVIMRSRGFDVQRALEIIDHHRCTDALLFPVMVYEFLSRPDLLSKGLSNLKRIYTGGSGILDWAIVEFVKKFPSVAMEQVYGLTEGGGLVTVMDVEATRRYPGSIGRPMPLTEIRIVDEQNGERDVGVGEDGELWVRSPSVSLGYYNAPEATQETFVDGWCKTGDVGRVNGEGYMFITGRKKDMIISAGENIYPAEIENVLSEHEAIVEAAVIGVPDSRYQEVPCAILVAAGTTRLSDAELTDYCRSRLAGYKRPRYFIYEDNLPRNAAGKVNKIDLRAKYAHIGDQPHSLTPMDKAPA
ncbi:MULTISPECIES: AMP-binding protein [Sinorhizobium]|uniref:class I adenylate-forming enzyme family protein n=1 Tax=Sinorhizobium TaxID=28105 RepID=UPI000BE9F76F|nr:MULTISPECIES: AMP-binding protein [Sinorhizobium]PDT50918.1 AMP-dependent synthetase [Sinorhizobium sp. NG07B]POH25036.1 hypothetical protein ATY30_28770 [Sinorhizobium americanum]